MHACCMPYNYTSILGYEIIVCPNKVIGLIFTFTFITIIERKFIRLIERSLTANRMAAQYLKYILPQSGK